MLIYLDTHVVVWLYSGLTDKITDLAKSLIKIPNTSTTQF